MARVKGTPPAELPSVLGLLGMTQEELAELEAHWKARMRADLSLSARYATLYADARAKLA